MPKSKTIILEALGWLGTVSILLAYFLNSVYQKSNGSGTLIALNLFGSFGMGVYACFKRAWAGVCINLVWLVISLVTVARILFAF